MKEKDCDTCTIASYSNCIRCENCDFDFSDFKDEMEWAKKKDLDIDWEEVYKKQGAWR